MEQAAALNEHAYAKQLQTQIAHARAQLFREYAILNAVAMITGTGDFRQLAGVGFLIGVLLVLFQGILQGGRGIRFQNVLVAWLLYALMFGPTARVAIEDAYSGAVRMGGQRPPGAGRRGLPDVQRRVRGVPAL